MKFLKSIIAASVLATSMLVLGTGNSYATALVPVTFNSSGVALFSNFGTGVLGGGQDTIDFLGLSPGDAYNFTFSMSSANTTIVSVLLSMAVPTNVTSANGGPSVLGSGVAPFSLIINGTPGVENSAYSGQLVVTQVTPSVPEAGTYLLLFAGLGIVGLAARYRMFA